MLDQIKAYANVIIAVIVVVAVLGLTWYVKHLQSTIEKDQQTITTLQASIETQNAAIEQLGIQTEERNKRVEEAVKKASERVAVLEKRAGTIYNLPTPKEDVCKKALELGNEK